MVHHCLHSVFKSLIATEYCNIGPCTGTLCSGEFVVCPVTVKEVLCYSGTRAKQCIIERIGINGTQISRASGR